MNRLELGKYWLAHLGRVLPDASMRLITRMAWHLAALSVQTEEELFNLSDAALCEFQGGSRHFIVLRSQFLNRRSAPKAVADTIPVVTRQLRSNDMLV